MTDTITKGSPYTPSHFVRWLGKPVGAIHGDGAMHSEGKLVWFYTVGACALTSLAVALQISALLTHATDRSNQ